jgi:TPR repeat protein
VISCPNSNARFDYGVQLVDDNGNAMDKSLAAQHYKLSVDQGNSKAQNQLRTSLRKPRWNSHGSREHRCSSEWSEMNHGIVRIAFAIQRVSSIIHFDALK